MQCVNYNVFSRCFCAQCAKAQNALMLGTVLGAVMNIARYVNTPRDVISPEIREDADVALNFLEDLLHARLAEDKEN